MDREDVEEKIKQLNEKLEIKLSKWEKQFSDADKDFARVCFKRGVDWTEEQMEAEIRHLEALVETQKAIIDYKENQLSVLTEQLDAAHIFCEGVKDAVVNKACKWLENEYFNGKLREINGSWFVFESEFMQAMKGE